MSEEQCKAQKCNDDFSLSKYEHQSTHEQLSGCDCIENDITPACDGWKCYLKFYDSDCEEGKLPSNYGNYCKAWDSYSENFDCRYNEHDYCSAKWCFVGDECNAPDAADSAVGSPHRYSY